MHGIGLSLIFSNIHVVLGGNYAIYDGHYRVDGNYIIMHEVVLWPFAYIPSCNLFTSFAW